MPASAHVVPAQGESVRPSPPSHQQLQQPHANGPSSRSITNGTPITHNRLHKHSHSTDAQRTQDMYSKPLPTAPRESARISRSTPMTQDQDRYRAHQVQKSLDKDYPPTPSSNDHNSLSSSHGHSSASQSQQHHHYNHGNTYSHSSHPSSNSIGRHRSATVAGVHGGSAAGLDTSTSSSSSAQGHGKLRRKPVRQLEDSPTEHFGWEPGSEPRLLSPTEDTMPIMGSTGRRNRSVGIYRDAPGSATVPANAQATYSRATGASAATTTKTERYVLQDATQPTLPRHHHSAHASIPAGSSRTTVQKYFPESNANQDKLVYKASSSNGHGSGNASANSSTPTPKANAFNGNTTAAAPSSNGTNTPTPAHTKHKSYNLTMSSSDVAMLATAPAAASGFTIPLANSSSDERPRRRKDSHRRTTSGAVNNLGASTGSQHSHHHHALSNSTTSASTEDSSHDSGDGGDQTGSDMWRSGTSLSQMSQGHPSMAQKHGAYVQQQLSHSQQRISPPAAAGGPPNTAATQGPGSAYRRSRGISDAPAPQSHYSHTGPHVVKLHSSNSRSSKDEKRPGTATSESRSGRDDYDDDDNSRDRDRGRGRTKEKDTSFMGRVRSRSNSLTKAITKVTIEYPKYLVNKMSGKRESKRLGAGGSSGVLAYSEHGHGNASGEAFDGAGYAPYPPSTSTSTTTASTSAHSPISAAHHNHSRSNIIHPSQNPFNALPPTSSKKREHKRSLSAQPALGNGGGLSPAPSSFAQPRLKKPMTHKELEKRNQYRTSPMTLAKNEVLQMWQDVDLNPRQSGAYHAQVQLTQQQQKYVVEGGAGGIAFPRYDKEREYVPTSAVPYSTERSAPRRR